MRSLFAAGLISIALAASVGAQAPAPLRARDFRILGLTHSADTADVRRKFGNPRTVEDRHDPDYPMTQWVYRSFKARFLGTSNISGFLLTGPRVQTARGLRVGQTRSRVRQLYGPPPTFDGPQNDCCWSYRDPTTEAHIVQVRFNGDLVQEIYLGYVGD